MDMTTSNSAFLKELKSKYIELISQGYVEHVALEKLNFPRGAYLRLMLDDRDFNLAVGEARKARADFWVAKIVEDLDSDYDAKEIPTQRLKFDKLQFLAKADDPDKYGNNSKKTIDLNIDLGKFKLLAPEQALKALAEDPFAPKIVEAAYTEMSIDEDNTEISIEPLSGTIIEESIIIDPDEDLL